MQLYHIMFYMSNKVIISHSFLCKYIFKITSQFTGNVLFYLFYANSSR